MARFIFGQFGMRPQDDKGNLLAYFDFIDRDLGLEFKDWKLMTGANGPFVSSPSEFWENKRTGKSGWTNFVMVSLDKEKNRNSKGVEFMQELTDAALAEYQKKTGKEAGSAAPAKKKSGTGVFQRGGPIDYEQLFPSPPSEDDDDLPF